jgi:hypothetical protein
MPQVDFKRQLKHLHRPSAKIFSVVDVPEMNFLMVDGRGDPNPSQEYQEAIEARYSLACQVKFTVKARDPELDHVVLALKGL